LIIPIQLAEIFAVYCDSDKKHIGVLLVGEVRSL
jgi:hypothetical protein